ncbi:MAG: hypothetical protein AB1393_12435 [Candidatus Edwardsbacteria bacterium]
MAALTEAQKRSFARQIIEIMKEGRAELTAEKFDVDGNIKEQEAQNQEAEKAEGTQTKAYADFTKASKISQEKTGIAYRGASDRADAIVGTLGRNHSISKRIRQIRDLMVIEAKRGKKRGETPA